MVLRSRVTHSPSQPVAGPVKSASLPRVPSPQPITIIPKAKPFVRQLPVAPSPVIVRAPAEKIQKVDPELTYDRSGHKKRGIRYNGRGKTPENPRAAGLPARGEDPPCVTKGLIKRSVIVGLIYSEYGNKSRIADALGMVYQTIWEWESKYPWVTEAFRMALEKKLDKADYILSNSLDNMSESQARFIATTQGRKRGYIRTTEIKKAGSDLEKADEEKLLAEEQELEEQLSRASDAEKTIDDEVEEKEDAA